ncbi:MAG: metallophosphoesterase [Oscillospiraceae bacterium]|nr:metallophosphoesterase [Oscillospiraceae bacterium]
MRKAVALLLCVCILFLPACGGRSAAPAQYHVIVATDLHYIAPQLTDHGESFTKLVDGGDGKLMRWIEELCDAFFGQVIQQKPEALILTGDLTFNGAVLSHEALAEKLRAVEAAGIPVLVQTGNHDLYNSSAASFSGDSFTRVPSATTEVFREVYGEFGYDEALSVDSDSLSYIYQLNDSTRVLLLDANTAHDPCGLSDSTLKWVEQQLRQARREGQHVLTGGHQNLMQQTMFNAGYVMSGADRLLKLLQRYQVPLFLSGHLHVQHYKTAGTVTEIATSALSVSPCQYGVLRAEDGHIRYETREVDVSAWARRQGRTEPELLEFKAYAADYFDRRTRAQIPESLEGFPYTPEEVESMTDYICALNRCYFSGNMAEAAELDPDGSLAALWGRSVTLYSVYLASIREDMGKDFRIWKSG